MFGGKTQKSTCVFLVLTFLSFDRLPKPARGDGSVFVLFQHYDNPSGQRFDEDCCDGKIPILCRLKAKSCDYVFTVCLGDGSHIGTISDAACPLGQQTSAKDELKNFSDVDFEDFIGNLDNPLEFTFEGTLPVILAIKINVIDHDDSTDDDLVDYLVHTVSLTYSDTVEEFTAIGTREAKPTKLNGEVFFTCARDWYGPGCGVYCESTLYYDCDPNTGEWVCKPGWTGPHCQHPVRPTTYPHQPDGGFDFVDRDNADCDNLARAGYRYRDGVYELRVAHFPPFRAYCDMSSEGWTVIQRRMDGDVNFRRPWSDYEAGFGHIVDSQSEYWLGLEKIYWLTNQRSYKLRITMQLGNGEFRYAEYQTFYVESAATNYILHVGGYLDSGTAGDAFGYLGDGGMKRADGQPFSTYDRDNDNWTERNCARVYNSGWWFNDCHQCNLNGPYISQGNGWPRCPSDGCVFWGTIEGYDGYSLIKTEMKILPNLD